MLCSLFKKQLSYSNFHCSVFCLSRGFGGFLLYFSDSYRPRLSRTSLALAFNCRFAYYIRQKLCELHDDDVIGAVDPRMKINFILKSSFFLRAWLSSLSQHKSESSQFILSSLSPLSSASFKLKNSVEIDENIYTHDTTFGSEKGRRVSVDATHDLWVIRHGTLLLFLQCKCRECGGPSSDDSATTNTKVSKKEAKDDGEVNEKMLTQVWSFK